MDKQNTMEDKNKKNVINLDYIFITPSVYNRWVRMIPEYVSKIQKTAIEKRIPFSLEDIPNEQFRADKDGNGELFIEIPKLDLYFNIVVHPYEWAFIGVN